MNYDPEINMAEYEYRDHDTTLVRSAITGLVANPLLESYVKNQYAKNTGLNVFNAIRNGGYYSSYTALGGNALFSGSVGQSLNTVLNKIPFVGTKFKAKGVSPDTTFTQFKNGEFGYKNPEGITEGYRLYGDQFIKDDPASKIFESGIGYRQKLAVDGEELNVYRQALRHMSPEDLKDEKKVAKAISDYITGGSEEYVKTIDARIERNSANTDVQLKRAKNKFSGETVAPVTESVENVIPQEEAVEQFYYDQYAQEVGGQSAGTASEDAMEQMYLDQYAQESVSTAETVAQDTAKKDSLIVDNTEVTEKYFQKKEEIKAKELANKENVFLKSEKELASTVNAKDFTEKHLTKEFETLKQSTKEATNQQKTLKKAFDVQMKEYNSEIKALDKKFEKGLGDYTTEQKEAMYSKVNKKIEKLKKNFDKQKTKYDKIKAENMPKMKELSGNIKTLKNGEDFAKDLAEAKLNNSKVLATRDGKINKVLKKIGKKNKAYAISFDSEAAKVTVKYRGGKVTEEITKKMADIEARASKTVAKIAGDAEKKLVAKEAIETMAEKTANYVAGQQIVKETVKTASETVAKEIAEKGATTLTSKIFGSKTAMLVVGAVGNPFMFAAQIGLGIAGGVADKNKEDAINQMTHSRAYTVDTAKYLDSEAAQASAYSHSMMSRSDFQDYTYINNNFTNSSKKALKNIDPVQIDASLANKDQFTIF